MDVKSIIIDCDTGVDDALALLLALRSPALSVRGITTVSGNVTLDKVVPNTLRVVEHAGRHTPVYAGAAESLLGRTITAEMIHGSDGLGDLDYPPPTTTPHKTHAVDFLIDTYLNDKNPPHLVTLGPLTNLALALQREPVLEERIPSLLMMAGGVTGGNESAAAEFNIAVDPEAADIVMRSGIPKVMVPLEPIFQGGSILAEDVAKLETVGTPWADMAGRLFRFQLNMWAMIIGSETPASPPDLAAMAVMIDPTLAQLESYYVAVELKGEHTRGMTVVDRRWYRAMAGAPADNVQVAMTMDNDRYRKLVVDILSA